MNEVIRTIHVRTEGDPSVGIGSQDAEIVAPGDFLMDLTALDEGEQAFHLNVVRNLLSVAFSEMWGEKATVTFDFEADAQWPADDDEGSADGVTVCK